jgi:hypothetical protein
MLLDAVLAQRGLQWLATEREKVGYFTLTQRVPLSDLPALTFTSDAGQTVRHFPDKLPIGLGEDGRTYVFLYLATRPEPIDFRMFLERHAELLRALPAWTVRVLIPHHLVHASGRYKDAFREQVGTPLRPAQLDELRWFFEARRGSDPRRDERFERARRAFGAPRFRALYRVWLERGDGALDAVVSPTLGSAIARQTGQFETCVLAHRYLHLAPLVGTA